MKLIEDFKNKVICGDCLELMKEIPDESIDAIVTDPPYELGFMGKKWDNSGIAYNIEMWKECFRVLKPGGHLLSFGGTRTYHRMVCSIEDAGFEIRDMIEWVYGSGFPKSLNVAKMIEGKLVLGSANTNAFKHLKGKREKIVNGYTKMEFEQGNKPKNYNDTENGGSVTKPEFTTEEAKYWNGWGTALKPAHEPICMARKPLAEKTVAENVLKYGTGGINIDESRIGTEKMGGGTMPDLRDVGAMSKEAIGINKLSFGQNPRPTLRKEQPTYTGRFPSNLVHDGSEEVKGCFPEQKSGGRSSQHKIGNEDGEMFNHGIYGKYRAKNYEDIPSSSGNASRFFKSIIYQAKASKSERNKGCEGLEEKPKVFNGQSDKPSTDMKDVEKRFTTLPKANNHPTVKPLKLMEYLIKMVTPKGGIVLDPFAGSGTTLLASKMNGFRYIGIELTKEYIPIIEARLNSVKDFQQRLSQEVLLS